MNDANKPGFKDDSGKVLMGTLLEFPLALAAVAEVATFGANKYTRGGWKSVPNARVRYTDAMMRHLLGGDGVDSGPRGSGLLHEAHFVWNAIARLELRLREVAEGGSTMSTPAEPPEANGDPEGGTGTVLVWPDNSWVWEDNFTEEDTFWKGDDYERIRLPLSMGDEEIFDFLSRRTL